MGNATSSTYQQVANSDVAMFEPLMDESEAVTDERRRIEEAFYFSGTRPKEECKHEDNLTLRDLRDMPNPAEEKITENSPKKDGSYDPFCNLKHLEGWEGWSGLIHVLSTEDTLAGLSLKYSVSTDEIRRANCMTDDRLVSYTRVVIPVKAKKDIIDETHFLNNVSNDGEKGEAHRQRLKSLLKRMDTNNLGEGSVEYYLASNGFNLRQALAELESDASWEKSRLGNMNPKHGLPWNLYENVNTLTLTRD